MGCGDVRLLRTIGGVDFTRQERATLNKLTMPFRVPGQNPGVEERIAKVARERVGKMMDKWVGHE